MPIDADGDVDGLAGFRERRQFGRHGHRGDVLELHLRGDVGRNGHAKFRQHVLMLSTVKGACVVWSPVPFESDDQPVADQLVAAHAGHRRPCP